MRAREHTSIMLSWWERVGVLKADLAVRRADGTMAWHHDRPLDALPLAWARAENVRRADVYIRPARGSSWPLVFLDDVPVSAAVAIARKYAALVIQTSPAAGCHVWLRCAMPLDEDERCRAQRWLASRVRADKASVSGEHLGRLAGFRNWKRHGVWVNVVLASDEQPAWDPAVAIGGNTPRDASARLCSRSMTADTSPSGNEWGWVCGMLEAGVDPTIVHVRLVAHARPRRGSDAERYATRTIDRALRRRHAPPPATRDLRES